MLAIFDSTQSTPGHTTDDIMFSALYSGQIQFSPNEQWCVCVRVHLIFHAHKNKSKRQFSTNLLHSGRQQPNVHPMKMYSEQLNRFVLMFERFSSYKSLEFCRIVSST